MEHPVAITLSGFILGLLFSVFTPHLHAEKLYKWVDENGVVHYSDNMTPESNLLAHEELDARGYSRRVMERAKTTKERMSEKTQQTLAEKQQRIQAKKYARQRLRDHILLQTFTTERDLIMTRDDRLNAIDSIIGLIQNNNKRIAQQMEETRAQVTRLKNSGRPIPDNIIKKLEILNLQYKKNRDYVELKQKEKIEQSAKLDADISRFRELKGIEPVAETTDE